MHVVRLLVSVSVILGVVIACGGEPVSSPTAPDLTKLAAQSAVAGNGQPNVKTSAVAPGEESRGAQSSKATKVTKRRTWRRRTLAPSGEATCTMRVIVKKEILPELPDDATLVFKLKAKKGEAEATIYGDDLGSGIQPNCDIFFDGPTRSVSFLVKDLINRKDAVQRKIKIELHRHPNSDVECVKSGRARGSLRVTLESPSGGLENNYLKLKKPRPSGCTAPIP